MVSRADHRARGRRLGRIEVPLKGASSEKVDRARDRRRLYMNNDRLKRSLSKASTLLPAWEDLFLRKVGRGLPQEKGHKPWQ
jgi:hypothetical protein